MKYIWITAITIFVLWIGSLIGLSVMMINGEASNFIKKEYRYNVTYSSDDKDSTVDDAFLFTTSKDAVLALEDTVQNTTDFINKIEIVPSYQEEIYGKLGNTGHQYKNVIQTKEEDTAFTVVITEAQLKLDPTFTLYLPIGKKVQLNDKVKPYLFHGLQSSIKPGTHWYEMRDDFNLHCTDCN